MSDERAKHPRDANQLVKLIVAIATGEAEDKPAKEDGGKKCLHAETGKARESKK